MFFYPGLFLDNHQSCDSFACILISNRLIEMNEYRSCEILADRICVRIIEELSRLDHKTRIYKACPYLKQDSSLHQDP